jgi:hypothetical protein
MPSPTVRKKMAGTATSTSTHPDGPEDCRCGRDDGEDDDWTARMAGAALGTCP